MKMNISRLIVVLVTSLCMSATYAQQLAFPGAQGWGRFATGARNAGSVYHVTNLNDSGAGSLRDAVSQPNRIVVFDVSGVIRIQSRIVFSSNLYVAGQTAPGEGVIVYGDGVSFSGADNIIVRYMRFRMGAVGSKDKDCAGIANGQNMIFDHCSFAWGQDENFSINWDNKGTAPKNITLMNSIVGQGLMTHSAGGLMQAENVSLYRILLVDNSTRNFKVKGVNQYANNLVYNWKNAAYNMGGDSEGQSYANIESNLFINGPAVGGNCLTGGNANFHFYGADNWQDANRDGRYNPTAFTGDGGGDRQSQPYNYPELEKWEARDLVDSLLPEVGASLPYRDLADCYMIDEVLSMGTKGRLITNENELPIGVPTSWTWFKGEKPSDTDGDGMPDAWETANGTNPQLDDAMVVASNGYVNIENYLNSITKADRQDFLRAPLLLTLESSTQTSLTLSWADCSDNEEGFIVEMKIDGQFVEVGRTDGTLFTLADERLKPGTAYTVRICAYQGTSRSDYTPELIVKTRPEQVDIIDAENFQGTGDGEWLINPAEDQVVTLDEPVEKTAVVVRSDAHVTLDGKGYVCGNASMNKTGEGVLTVASDQQYEGATVLHKGIYEFASLKNGGEPSGIGMSQEFAQNWVMDGGSYRYTGSSTTTNRSAMLYNDTQLDIAAANTVVTMNGSIEGQGNLALNGQGTLSVGTNNFFGFDGDVVMRGGVLKLAKKEVSDKGIGKASRLVMAGGQFVTVGKNESSVTYNFPIVVEEGTTSVVDFDLWNSNKCRVSGSGTLQWNVHYLREYIEGNWDGFTGHLIVNGTGKAGQSQFAVKNGVGVKNATLYLKGTASVNGAKNASTYYLGGLSGDASTVLAGFNVKAKGQGTWVVGTANTDETFRGVINDNDQAGSHPGTTSIEKQGSGDWRLTGKNVYSGTTVVSRGCLIVNGTHTGRGAISVKSGAILAGEGTLAGKVTVSNNATIHAGDTLTNMKTLTLSGGLTIAKGGVVEIPLTTSGNFARCNKLKIAGDFTVNDAVLCLDITEATAIADDKSFLVFDISAANVSGTGFVKIEPEQPSATQKWDTSELLTTGRLYVRSAVDTGIHDVHDSQQTITYDLTGRVVAEPHRGLYVQNGKKIVKK
ncbi:MAG: hypothetical protein K5683_00160 [Prevotella sp.]|nr:hypothetical protein [Prevotella sp.]